MPALFTTMSARCQRSSAACTSAAASRSVVRSPGTPTASIPPARNSAARSCARSVVAPSAIAAPRPPSSRQAAKPMPSGLPAPVTIATLPLRSNASGIAMLTAGSASPRPHGAPVAARDPVEQPLATMVGYDAGRRVLEQPVGEEPQRLAPVMLAAGLLAEPDPDIEGAGRQRAAPGHERLDPADAPAAAVDGQVKPAVPEPPRPAQPGPEGLLVGNLCDRHRVRADHGLPLGVDLVRAQRPEHQARSLDPDLRRFRPARSASPARPARPAPSVWPARPGQRPADQAAEILGPDNLGRGVQLVKRPPPPVRDAVAGVHRINATDRSPGGAGPGQVETFMLINEPAAVVHHEAPPVDLALQGDVGPPGLLR